MDFCRKQSQNALWVQTWRDLTILPAFLFLPHEGIWLSHPSWTPHLTLLLCHSHIMTHIGTRDVYKQGLQSAPSLPKSHKVGRSEQKPDINSVGMNACSPCWCYIATWSAHLSELKVQVKLILFTVVQDYRGKSQYRHILSTHWNSRQ